MATVSLSSVIFVGGIRVLLESSTRNVTVTVLLAAFVSAEISPSATEKEKIMARERSRAMNRFFAFILILISAHSALIVLVIDLNIVETTSVTFAKIKNPFIPRNRV